MFCIICDKNCLKTRKNQRTCFSKDCVYKNRLLVKRNGNKLYQRKYRKDNLLKLRLSRIKYQRLNKDKILAHRALNIAKKKGLIKKLPCEKCGNKYSVAHHYLGYSKKNWLRVIWLCISHHRIAHKLSTV